MRSNMFLRYYSDIDPTHGFYTISIDNSTPEQLNGNSRGHRTQQMLWSKTNLTPGKHTFTLRQLDIPGKVTTLDFFRSVISEIKGQYLTHPLFHYFLLRLRSVLRAEDASALPSSTTSASKSNIVPLAVGIPLGLLALAIAVLGAIYIYRRCRKPAPVDTETELKP